MIEAVQIPDVELSASAFGSDERIKVVGLNGSAVEAAVFNDFPLPACEVVPEPEVSVLSIPVTANMLETFADILEDDLILHDNLIFV